MTRSITTIAIIFHLFFSNCTAQFAHENTLFTHQDTLRGTNGPGRDWWDVKNYTLRITPDYGKKEISGICEILFEVTKPGNNKIMQIDLQEPMEIISAKFHDSPDVLKFKREKNIYWFDFGDKDFRSDSKAVNGIMLQFKGKPKEAKRPPWDGGWIFTKDVKGRPWMSVACQGLGSSVWFPCKDYQGDEPDQGSKIFLYVPDSLSAVSNGINESPTVNLKNIGVYVWKTSNPINNYNIIPYIGKYVNWTETYQGEKGKLDCSYWVLDYNLEKAKEQFKQAAQTLKAFEHWFGPYPFL